MPKASRRCRFSKLDRESGATRLSTRTTRAHLLGLVAQPDVADELEGVAEVVGELVADRPAVTGVLQPGQGVHRA